MIKIAGKRVLPCANKETQDDRNMDIAMLKKGK